MKIKIHKPVEEYGFVEAEEEVDFENPSQLEQLRNLYDDIGKVFKNSDGLEDKEWREVLDKYLETNEMESNQYERMSLEQKRIIQEIKKSVKRMNYKNNKENND